MAGMVFTAIACKSVLSGAVDTACRTREERALAFTGDSARSIYLGALLKEVRERHTIERTELGKDFRRWEPRARLVLGDGRLFNAHGLRHFALRKLGLFSRLLEFPRVVSNLYGFHVAHGITRVFSVSTKKIQKISFECTSRRYLIS